MLLVLRATGLNQPREHAPRYGLRLGLGIIALAVAVFMSLRARRTRHAPRRGHRQRRRPAKTPARAARKPGLVARLTARPRPATAFLAGLLLFAPSATFIAAVQVIATANAGASETVLAIVIVVTLTARPSGCRCSPTSPPRRPPRAPCGRPTSGSVAHGRKLVIGAPAVAGVGPGVNGALGIWTADSPRGRRDGRGIAGAVIYVTPAWRKTCHGRPIYGTLVL